jgi:tetratricopeptide (TPR) repeat protein
LRLLFSDTDFRISIAHAQFDSWSIQKIANIEPQNVAGLALRRPGIFELEQNMTTAAPALAAAVQHYKSGRLAEAEAMCRQIIAVQPQHADALHLLGMIAHQTKHYQAAAKLFSRAIALNDDAARYHHSLGNTLQALQRVPEAMQSYRRAIERNPTLAIAHHRLGLLEYASNNFAGAAKSFDAATLHAPNFAKAHAALGSALCQMGRLEEAVARYRRALALDPTDAMSHSNLGLVLQDLGLLEESIEHCQRAIALQPDFPAAHNHLGLALLLKGDFENGLLHHEWRWRVRGLRLGKQRFDQPAWRGEPLSGARMLLYPEQGAGDTLQFLRYAPLVAARGGHVIIEVPQELKRLAISLKGVQQVIAAGEPLPAFDQHCPFLSLPLAFQTTMQTIPGDTPYLAAPEPLRADWRARLAASASPRIGLVWAGRPEHRRDRDRSIALATLAPLASTGATFYALQKGPAAQQAKTPPPGMMLHDLADALGDFADTAAAMSALDLVITVDTSPAHLAGAIGTPVWVLLPHTSDWRWFLDRDDSPWYPSARLFRQKVRADWEPVITRVAGELRRYIAGDKTALTPS